MVGVCSSELIKFEIKFKFKSYIYMIKQPLHVSEILVSHRAYFKKLWLNWQVQHLLLNICKSFTRKDQQDYKSEIVINCVFKHFTETIYKAMIEPVLMCCSLLGDQRQCRKKLQDVQDRAQRLYMEIRLNIIGYPSKLRKTWWLD